MRYPPGHKERTRTRILDSAARLFRKHGYRGVSIDRIMAAAEAESIRVVDVKPGEGLSAMWEISLGHYLTVAAILFTIGTLGVIFRRNALIMFMSVELMLTAVNLSLIAFSRAMGDLHGHVFVLFIFAVGVSM